MVDIVQQVSTDIVLSDKSEAEAGTNNTKFMTPLRTKEAITKQFDSIRYSKLDNPLCHLFKKNKLVDTLAGQLTWTRDSGATYIDRNGVLKHSPSPYATNLCLYSEDFSNAAWTKVSLSIGTKTKTYRSILLSEVVDNSVSHAYVGQTISLNAGLYTVSTFVAKNTSQFARFGVINGASTLLAIVNIDTGEYVSTGAGIINPSYEKLSSEVARISFSFHVTADATSVDIRAYGASGASSSATDTGSTFYGGVQVGRSMVANGYIKTIDVVATGKSLLPINQPREESKGWLIEGARTNSCKDSSFQKIGAAAVWSLNHSPIITPNNSAAPDGTVTACKVEANEAGAGLVQLNAHATLTDTCSVWLRGAVGGEKVAFGFGGTRITVTLTTEWVRYQYTGNNTGSTSFTLYSSLATAQTFYVWGAQSEAASMSSYIPTESAAVTRARDVVSIQSYTNHPRLDNIANEFSYCMAVSTNAWGINSSQEVISSTSLSAKYSVIRFNPLEVGLMYYRGSGARPFSTQLKNVYRISVSYLGGNEVSLYEGGVKKSTTAETMVTLGNNAIIPIGNSLFGHIQDFRIYDFALNDAEAAFLAGE